MESQAPAVDVIAMNLTIAALEPWLKNVPADRSGADLGREIAALYREIHNVVEELSPEEEDEDDFDFDDDEDEKEEDARD